jgi:hypothetical protein
VNGRDTASSQSQPWVDFVPLDLTKDMLQQVVAKGKDHQQD